MIACRPCSSSAICSRTLHAFEPLAGCAPAAPLASAAALSLAGLSALPKGSQLRYSLSSALCDATPAAALASLPGAHTATCAACSPKASAAGNLGGAATAAAGAALLGMRGGTEQAASGAAQLGSAASLPKEAAAARNSASSPIDGLREHPPSSLCQAGRAALQILEPHSPVTAHRLTLHSP